MKTYIIREGFTFVGDDGKQKFGGDTIELEDDVAAVHLHKLELVEAEADPAAKAVDTKSAKKAAKDSGQASLDDGQSPAADSATNG